jgi:hypothetical protein
LTPLADIQFPAKALDAPATAIDWLTQAFAGRYREQPKGPLPQYGNRIAHFESLDESELP